MSTVIAAPRRFVLLASPRTGSTNLALTLDHHPNVACGGELLNPDYEIWDQLQIRRPDMTTLEILEAGFGSGPLLHPGSRIECTGYKILDYQVARGSRYSDALGLLAEMKDLYIITLTRRNLLQCVRSDAQAHTTHEYHRPRKPDSTGSVPTVRLEYDACLAFFLRTERFLASIDALFSDSRRLQLVYEDIYADFDRTVELVESFLEVSLQPLEQPLAKQEGRPLCQAIENYYELKTAFQDTEYSRFFA